MAWTQTDIDALKSAMAKGVKRVRYASGETEYQTVAEMRELLADMEREVNPDINPSRRAGVYRSGY